MARNVDRFSIAAVKNHRIILTGSLYHVMVSIVTARQTRHIISFLIITGLKTADVSKLSEKSPGQMTLCFLVPQ